MNISTYIRDEILAARLRRAGCLVVYDAHGRYGDVCRSLASERVRVVDASGGSIAAREEASAALCALGEPHAPLDALLIYVPAAPPLRDEQRWADPFAAFAVAGAVFPQDDGDDYLALCLRARPDHGPELRRLFEQDPDGPSFAVVDAIGGGVRWPQLRAALGVESALEIAGAVMAESTADARPPTAGKGPSMADLRPSSDVDSSGGRRSAVSRPSAELREFLSATLGMTLRTKLRDAGVVAEEVWQFVLFSEFAFDLPGGLPPALQSVPRAPGETRPFVDALCRQLRDQQSTREAYIAHARRVEAELKLKDACAGIDDLGERDTFPFEERTFLTRAVRALCAGDVEQVQRVLDGRARSVWRETGDGAGQWEVLSAALALLSACDAAGERLMVQARDIGALVNFYVAEYARVDQRQREFEQAVAEAWDVEPLRDAVAYVRARHRAVAEKVQAAYIRQLEASGWPPAALPANADTFDVHVAPLLREKGRRAAYFMIDALRYELGAALERLLAENTQVQLHAACAQLPTVTPVGMASLLPGARAGLALTLRDGALTPTLDGAPVRTVAERMDALRRRYGDRFQEALLSDFVAGKAAASAGVDLLVLRSTEIDSHFEHDPQAALGMVTGQLRQIQRALHALRGAGFSAAVIAADHGFAWHAQSGRGDVCTRPAGAWAFDAHHRMLLGAGGGDAQSVVLDAARLGMRGDFAQAALPRSQAPYQVGHEYLHGGASLAEAIVPVLVVKLPTASERRGAERGERVALRYRNGANRITTYNPKIEVLLESDGLFGVPVVIEAHDAQGRVVGELKAGERVDPTSRQVVLTPGEPAVVILRMSEQFEGKCTVKVLNPTTQTTYTALELETDYNV